MPGINDIITATLLGAGKGAFQGLNERRRREAAQGQRQFDSQQAAIDTIIKIGLTSGDNNLREFAGSKIGERAGIENFKLPPLSEYERLSIETKNLDPGIRKRIFQEKFNLPPDLAEQALAEKRRAETSLVQARERAVISGAGSKQKIDEARARQINQKIAKVSDDDLESLLGELNNSLKTATSEGVSLATDPDEVTEKANEISEMISTVQEEILKRKGLLRPPKEETDPILKSLNNRTLESILNNVGKKADGDQKPTSESTGKKKFRFK